jgi:hypothetical protein
MVHVRILPCTQTEVSRSTATNIRRDFTVLLHIQCDRFRTQDVPHVPKQSTLNCAAKSVNIAYDRLVRI